MHATSFTSTVTFDSENCVSCSIQAHDATLQSHSFRTRRKTGVVFARVRKMESKAKWVPRKRNETKQAKLERFMKAKWKQKYGDVRCLYYPKWTHGIPLFRIERLSLLTSSSKIIPMLFLSKYFGQRDIKKKTNYFYFKINFYRSFFYRNFVDTQRCVVQNLSQFDKVLV